MRATESNRQTGLNGTQNGAEFVLFGGIYQISAIATWGGGSVELYQIGPDGATWLSVSDPITTNGGDTIYLAPGRYRWSIVTATGVSLMVTRVPGE
jgi:hypothetical protein